MTTETFEPKIIAFVCHYCTYSAADLAGSMRLEYPPNVRIVKLMCTGKVEPILLMKALEDGADIVMVSGCEEGDCHFLEGNLKAREAVRRTRKLIEEAGLEPDRLKFFNIGASDAPKWAAAVKELTETGQRLGPNPLRTARACA